MRTSFLEQGQEHDSYLKPHTGSEMVGGQGLRAFLVLESVGVVDSSFVPGTASVWYNKYGFLPYRYNGNIQKIENIWWDEGATVFANPQVSNEKSELSKHNKASPHSSPVCSYSQ